VKSKKNFHREDAKSAKKTEKQKTGKLMDLFLCLSSRPPRLRGEYSGVLP